MVPCDCLCALLLCMWRCFSPVSECKSKTRASSRKSAISDFPTCNMPASLVMGAKHSATSLLVRQPDGLGTPHSCTGADDNAVSGTSSASTALNRFSGATQHKRVKVREGCYHNLHDELRIVYAMMTSACVCVCSYVYIGGLAQASMMGRCQGIATRLHVTCEVVIHVAG